MNSAEFNSFDSNPACVKISLNIRTSLLTVEIVILEFRTYKVQNLDPTLLHKFGDDVNQDP